MQDQVKYLEQKYSGNWNPLVHSQGQQQPIGAQKDHPVPIENYLNAQCMHHHHHQCPSPPLARVSSR